MTTNSEAPISVNSTIYYRGVSTSVTKRDPEMSIDDYKKLIQEQLDVIDWLLDVKNAKPSWNKETNNDVQRDSNEAWINQGAGAPMTPQQQAVQAEVVCPIHNVPMKWVDGKFGRFTSHYLGKDPQTGKAMYCKGK